MFTRTTHPADRQESEKARTASETRGRIVVGVDGSEGSARALRWAVDEARHRNAVLEVVYAWEPSFVPHAVGVGSYTPVTIDGQEEAEAAQTVAAAVAAISDAGVELRPSPRRGPTLTTLLDAARGADLLVVGSRGRGGFASVVLGSTSQALAHHTPCPLVIVPPPRPR